MTLLKSLRPKPLLMGCAALAAVMALGAPAFAWQDGWAYRTKITLDPSRAGVQGDPGTQAVLIRLHSGNFSFADAKADGSDLRFFAGDDKTPLKYQIERWSPKEEVGLVWVQVPDLKGSGPTPIFAYYGNAKASPAGEARGVFGDKALVWHFAEDGAPQDASGHAITGSLGGARDADGLIGQALKLDGKTGIGLPTSFSLSGAGTLSLWVKPAAANGAGALFSQPGGLTLGLANGAVYAEAGGKRAQGAQALSADSWTHVAVVSDGQTITLYVNGQAVGQIAGGLGQGAGQASVGQGFAGEIDELEVSATAEPAAAIQLAASSQGVGSKLLSFDKAEETKGMGHGYLAILFKALTPDAWVVIGLLAIMSLVSWFVMITKWLHLTRISAANDQFLEAYEQASSRRSEHDGLPELPADLARGASSLAHLYRIGQRELAKRLNEGKASGSRFALRPQSVAAIRSALDAGQTREAQKLNKWMVLLTIAISGGPFLGLLGTVIGVMITFASVAAAGDVNINAIAPGIAAALLATVTGLAVAIPALFGYNYLLSQVEEISTDDQIFVDELEKRIAETWQDAPQPRTAA